MEREVLVANSGEEIQVKRTFKRAKQAEWAGEQNEESFLILHLLAAIIFIYGLHSFINYRLAWWLRW